MINIRTIKKLRDGDGMTLLYGKVKTYNYGWQVATSGIETRSPQAAIDAVRGFGGSCGIWFHNGIYYIDFSHHVVTKKEAMAIGRAHNQISIYGWKNDVIVYCAEG